MNDWEEYDFGEDICPYCNATFRGDMLRDHIVLEHCHESEKENNYKVVLAEHSLKSLYHAQEEEEVQIERQLRSRKVEGVVGSNKSKKRTLKDWSQDHQSLLIKMNESIIDDVEDEPSSSEPPQKRRSIGNDSQEIHSDSATTPLPTPEKIVEKHEDVENQESIKQASKARRSQRNPKPKTRN